MTWVADVLPQSPLYVISQAAWRPTIAYVSVSEFRSQLGDQGAVLVPKLKANWHWATRAQAGNAIAHPLNFPPTTPDVEQRAHLEWTYDYCLEVEGAMMLERYRAVSQRPATSTGD